MLRVLHLLDPHDGQEPMIACRAAMSIGAARHDLWLVTDSFGERAAAEFGMASTDRIGTILGRPASAAGGLRALLDHRTDDLAEPAPDLVQCWSARILGAARAAFGKRVLPRCAVLTRPPLPAWTARGSLQAYRHAKALDDTTLLTLDLATREGWAPLASAGRGAMRMRDNIRVCKAPPLLPEARPDRAACRESLGLEPDDVAVLLLADPPAAGDAMRFAFQIGLQHVGGVRVVGVIPRSTMHARRGARFVAGHGRRWGLVESPAPADRLLAAADAALWDVREDGLPSCGATLLGASVQAGVPIAAARHDLSGQVLRDAPACLARDATSRSVASKLFELITSGAREAALIQLAAVSTGWRERDEYRRVQRALWEERANVPVLRPGLPVPMALAGSAR